MDIDFSLVIVSLVGFTGFVYGIDLLFFAGKRKAAVERYRNKTPESAIDQDIEAKLLLPPPWIEYPKSFFPVLFLVLILRSFLIEPFKIPSGSMIPTLQVGDYILVNKFAYGIRLPVIGTEVFPIDLPERGDVMVFKYPENPRINYIKRVIGLPGDQIHYENKQLYINGELVPRSLKAQLPPMMPQKEIYNEVLGGVEHDIQMYLNKTANYPDTWTLGEGEYFMMGDNRDNSRDSRSWGIVPEANIVGKAFAVWMHMPGWLPSFSNNRLIQ